MHTSDDFERAIRELYGIHSDYAFAKKIGVTRAAVSWRATAGGRGKRHVFSEESGTRIAELLDLDPAYVLACLAAERAKRPTVRAVWARVAEAFKETKRAAKVASLLIGLIILLPPAPAGATVTPRDRAVSHDFTRYTFYDVRRRRRRVSHLYKGLAAWLRTWCSVTPARGCA